jgi:hypothetical protein
MEHQKDRGEAKASLPISERYTLNAERHYITKEKDI